MLAYSVTVSVIHGRDGYHMASVIIYPRIYAVYEKISWIVAPVLFLLASGCSKLAVLFVYHSIFVNRRDRLLVKLVGLFILISTIIEIPIPIFQCRPIYKLWTLHVAGTCLSPVVVIRYGPIPSILTDLCLMVLPIPTIRKIQVPLRVKVGIFITFLLGSM
jgi:hypothetical protein